MNIVKRLSILAIALLMLSACEHLGPFPDVEPQIDPPSQHLDAGPDDIDIDTNAHIPVPEPVPVEPDLGDGIACIEIYAPVCGKVGDEWKTFSNDCYADAGGATDVYAGECSDGGSNIPKPCTREYRPVCGLVEVICITEPCDPVPQTFSNKCEAENAGATDITDGACS